MGNKAPEGQSKLGHHTELEYFICLANECCGEALVALSEPFKFLTDVDQLYMEFLPTAGGIRPTSAGILLLNAHSCFRASVRLALSGQLLPVFMTLRGSIESSLYGHAMVVRPALQEIWLHRDKDKNSRDACRREFTATKMFRILEDAHTKEFADLLRDIYESTIDFGAHPNSHSMVASTHIEKTVEGPSHLDFAYIQGARSFELRQALIASAEVGLAVFFVSLLANQKHPLLTNLNNRALELQNGLHAFICSMGFRAS
jgi:hypothetical protein